MTQPRTISPSGPHDAQICILGEAPNLEEVEAGVMFTGKAGNQLNRLLQSVGIEKAKCYVTAVVKTQPVRNDMLTIPQDGYDSAIASVRAEIGALPSCNVVIALGAHALFALTGYREITKRRGSVYTSILSLNEPKRPIKVIPTMHPNAPLPKREHIALVTADLAKAKRHSAYPELRKLNPVFELQPTLHRILEFLDGLLEARKPVSIDIESFRGTDIIRCIGFADSPDHALVIPLCKLGVGSCWTPGEETIIWEKIREVLTSRHVGKIIQNAMFELEMLYQWVGEVYPIAMDTMVCHHLNYPELPKGLGTLISLYTDEPYHKDEITGDLYEYNAKDCVTTYACALALEKELADHNLTGLYFGYENLLIRVMWHAARVGVGYDTERLAILAEKNEDEMRELKSALFSIIGEEININSPKQLRELIYGKLKYPVQYKRGARAPTTDDEALQTLASRHRDPVFNTILEIRKRAKASSTYLSDVSDLDGRVRTAWQVGGTVTGRLASRKNIRDTGCNMQNVPKNVRDIFVADRGTVFVVGDLSQVEARFVAWLSQDRSYKELFKQGGKIHNHVACWIYNIPELNITKEQYKRAKATVHGGNYALGARTLASKRMLDIPVQEAEWLLQRFHNAFPGIHNWHEEVERSLQRNRTLISPYGRRRQMFGFWGPSLFREGYATIPQGMGSDTINMGAVRIFYQVSWDVMILLQVHDELVIQCPEGTEKTVAALFKKEVERPVVIHGDPLSIPVEIEVGKNWKDTECLEIGS